MIFDPPRREEVKGGGYVELEEMMGNDLTPAHVARISYMSEGDELEDIRLVKRLINLGHETPFEQQIFRFKIVGIPIYIGEQLLRHRIASPLKRSFRYTSIMKGVEKIDWGSTNEVNTIFHIPPEFLDLKNSKIKNKEQLLSEIIESFKRSMMLYQELVARGLRKEAARAVLPWGTRTSLYWTVNMRSLMNFMKLRLQPAAQWEMRELARAIARILLEVVPITFGYFIKRHHLKMEIGGTR